MTVSQFSNHLQNGILKYDTLFPEQGPTQALLNIVRPREKDREIIGTKLDNGLSATLHEVTLVAQVLYHFRSRRGRLPSFTLE